jgi:hydroxyquinol 1,2-dioxygenase
VRNFDEFTITDARPEQTTETTVLGPFFVKGAPEHGCGADISGGVSGDPMLVTGSVVDFQGKPIVGATVDV